ncbi:Acg family FMN-binding oxidoreductase [Pseudonocardia zijingensis]|uniref:NAD(P)H nitroreductase n=1 Tax=Pseudonocardia zijingensis TaxID=153376 RepID=A0ABN1PDG0_9PSEU
MIVDRRTVRSALALAVRAPSVHNSQPWRFVLGRTSVHLHTEPARWLPATDPNGRDLLVSCGIVLHHLRVALAAAGIRASVTRLPNPDQPDHLAAIELHAGPPAEADLGLVAAITCRRTDRRRFADWDVPDAFVRELIGRAAEQGAVLRSAAAGHERSLLLAAINDAAAVEDDDPACRAETALWSGRVADDTGVPAANLLREAPVARAAPARRFAQGVLEQDEDVDDGAVLLVLGAASDDPLSQLRAGEAASAVLLHATELGLATCPLSQPLEVDSAQIRIRDAVLGGTLCPQLLLRVGWAPAGPELPATPRLPIDETVERDRI